jgi:hypothetical protein
MDIINIGSRREVCWDEYLIDRAKDVRVQMHRPEFRNVVLDCNAPWEGNVCGYFVLLNDQEQFRLYYRGLNYDIDQDARPIKYAHATICYAESRDGKTFRRVPVHKVPFWGTADNNIILNTIRDNIYFFKDTNPNCAPEALYKGLGEADQALWLYESADGVNFEKKRVLADDGAYDSMNVAFWDENTEQYFLFYRGVHGVGTADGKWTAQQGGVRHHDDIVRDVRVRTSKDFVTWSEPQMIRFDPERDDLELYTNQVQPYYRAKHMFIGFPTRYVDRYEDAQNFAYLPDKEHRGRFIRAEGRTGTAMTDAVVMTSRDGLHFRRTEEAFLTPGVEREGNWYYGDCYFAYGMAETEGDRPGSPREISMYAGADYRFGPVKLCRYAIRLDGFLSWRCDYQPGTVITKPLIFDGGHLSINFATSALGYVRIRLLSEDGTPIEDFDSGKLFGDSVDRPVDFQGSLATLAGKPIRMEISMSDADLYSFRFTPEVNLC